MPFTVRRPPWRKDVCLRLEVQYTHPTLNLNKQYKPMRARVLGNLTIRAAAQELLNYADKDEFEEIFHVWRRASTKYSWHKDADKTQSLNPKQYLTNHDGVIFWTMTTKHPDYEVQVGVPNAHILPNDRPQEVIQIDP